MKRTVSSKVDLKYRQIIGTNCSKVIAIQRHTSSRPRFGGCWRQLQTDGLIDGDRQHYKNLDAGGS